MNESKGSGMSTYLLRMVMKTAKYNKEHTANEKAHPTIIAGKRRK